jgi:hypothetical protein
VVWTLILQSKSEGPTLISCAAKLLKGDLHLQISFSRLRGARPQRILVAVNKSAFVRHFETPAYFAKTGHRFR